MTHLDRHPAIVTHPCGCHTASHDGYDHPVLCRCPRHRGEWSSSCCVKLGVTQIIEVTGPGSAPGGDHAAPRPHGPRPVLVPTARGLAHLRPRLSRHGGT